MDEPQFTRSNCPSQTKNGSKRNRGGGRPSTKTEEIITAILEAVGKRGYVTDAAHLKPIRTIYDWAQDDATFRNQLANAVEVGTTRRKETAYSLGIEPNLERPVVAVDAYKLAQKDEELKIRREEAKKPAQVVNLNQTFTATPEETVKRFRLAVGLPA